MKRRLLGGYVLITLLVLALHDIPFLLAVRNADRERLVGAVERDASVMATYVVQDLEAGTPQELQPAIARYQERTGARVVVTDRTGRTVADTDLGSQAPGGGAPGDAAPNEETADRRTDRQDNGRADSPGDATAAATTTGPVAGTTTTARTGRPGAEGTDLSAVFPVETALAGRRASGTRRAPGSSAELAFAAVPVAMAGTVYGAVVVAVSADGTTAVSHRALALAVSDLVTVAAVAVFGVVVATSVTEPLRQLRATAAALARGALGARAATDRGPVEVRDLARTFNGMAAQLTELISAQRAFVADASHQLRTPLTALQLRLAQLRAGLDAGPAFDGPAALGARTGPATGAEPGTEALSAADGALEEAARLHRLVEGLLTLARSEGTRPQRHRSAVRPLLEARAEGWQALAAERGVPLVVAAPDELEVLVAEGALEQVLDNLIDNALEVSPPGRPLVLSARAVGNEVAVEVADHGPGMSDAERDRAFDRLWRGRHRSAAGSGLGLAIVAQLAASSGGTASLRPNPGGGLVATVRLARPGTADGPRPGRASRPVNVGRFFPDAAPVLSETGAKLDHDRHGGRS